MGQSVKIFLYAGHNGQQLYIRPAASNTFSIWQNLTILTLELLMASALKLQTVCQLGDI